MKSQKQNNKAPRPFKNKNSGRDWSGGSSGGGGFIPGGPKPGFRASQKSSAAPPAPKPADDSPAKG